MSWLRPALHEMIGLFVEDGSLALALLGWVAAVALVLPRVTDAGEWTGPLLLAGCIAILAENVSRSARRSGRG